MEDPMTEGVRERYEVTVTMTVAVLATDEGQAKRKVMENLKSSSALVMPTRTIEVTAVAQLGPDVA
jgi:hypothetical protein